MDPTCMQRNITIFIGIVIIVGFLTLIVKSYQNGNHIEPSEKRLQEISIVKNLPRAGLKQETLKQETLKQKKLKQELNLCGCRSGNP